MTRRQWAGRQWWVAIAFVIALVLAPLTSNVVRANGVPTIIELSYIDGLSTWGPQDATGEVEISFSEGYALVTVTGLPALGEGRAYQGWLVNSDSNAAVTIGRFDADASAHINFNGSLPAIDEFGFDLFLITVEPDPDEGLQPTSDRTIGGYFSLLGPPPNEATSAADTVAATGIDGEAGAEEQSTAGTSSQQPAELPATGDPALLTDIMRITLLGVAVIVSLFLGLRLVRSNSARLDQ